MKSIKCLFLLALVVFTGVARADYECSSYEGGEVEMFVQENFYSRVGNTLVTLETNGEEKKMYGIMSNEGGFFMKKKVITFSLVPGALASITSHPTQCGRGGCDYDLPNNVSASLELGDEVTYFSCDEVKN